MPHTLKGIPLALLTALLPCFTLAADCVAAWTDFTGSLTQGEYTLALNGNASGATDVTITEAGVTIAIPTTSNIAAKRAFTLAMEVTLPTGIGTLAAFQLAEHEIKINNTLASLTTSYDNEAARDNPFICTPSGRHTITITYNGPDGDATGTRVYLNGSLAINDSALRWANQEVQQLTLGGCANGDHLRANMQIHAIRLYETQLSENEVKTDYTATLPEYTATLAAGDNTFSQLNWSPSTPDVNSSSAGRLRFIAKEAATLTLDAPLSISSFTVEGEGALTLLGESLTADTVTLRADTHLAAITAELGTITLAADQTLTLNHATFTNAAAITREASSSVIAIHGDEPLTTLPANAASIPNNIFQTAGTFILDQPLTWNGTLNLGGINETPIHHTVTFRRDLSATRLVVGNIKDTVTTLYQTGGNITLNATETSFEDATRNAINLAHWPSTVNYSLQAGKLTAPNGALSLGWDGKAYLTIGQDWATAGDTTAEVAVAKLGSLKREHEASLTVYPSGTLSIGAGGIELPEAKALILAGGTLKATATMANFYLEHPEGLQIAEASTIDIASGATATYAGIVSGATTLTKAGSGILDLSEADLPETLRYTITGGTLILPAGAEGANVNGVITPYVTVSPNGTGRLGIRLASWQDPTTYTPRVADGTPVTLYTADGNPIKIPTTWTPTATNTDWYDRALWTHLDAAAPLPGDGADVIIDATLLTAPVTLTIPSALASLEIKGHTTHTTTITFAETATPPPAVSVAGRVAVAYEAIASATLSVADEATLICQVTASGTWTHPLGAYTFEKVGNGSLTVTNGLSGTQAIRVQEGTLTLTTAHTDYSGAITIASTAKVEIQDATALGTGTLSGAGTLLCNGVLPANPNGLTVGAPATQDTPASGWIGIVKLDAITSAPDLNLALYGNAHSTLELGRIGGEGISTVYFPPKATHMTVASDIILSGTVDIRNGYADAIYSFTGAIRGSGTLAFPDVEKSFSTWKIYSDMSDFSGTLSAPARTGNAVGRLVFCSAETTTDTFDSSTQTTLVVADHATLNIHSEATYAAPAKMLGTLSGSGTLNGAVTFENAAFIRGETPLTVKGAVTVNGALTVTAAATIEPSPELTLLSTTSTPTLNNATATFNGARSALSARADGLVLTPAWPEDYSIATAAALQALGATPDTLIQDRAGNHLDANAIHAAMELFCNVSTLDDATDTLTVDYAFGLQTLTINKAHQVVATFKVDATSRPGEPTLAQGVTVELFTRNEADEEVLLATTVLPEATRTVTLATEATYHEIFETKRPDNTGAKALYLFARAKKASVKTVTPVAVVDQNTGTLVAAGSAINLYALTLTHAMTAEDIVTLHLSGLGTYPGQTYTLTAGEKIYTARLTESGMLSFTLTEALEANTPVTLAVADAAGTIQVDDSGLPPLRIQKMVAKTPEEDLNPDYDSTTDSGLLFPPYSASFRDMYRIPAIATNGEGEIVLIYDLRYVEGDLGQTTTATSGNNVAKTSVDIGESYSADAGHTWATFTHTVNNKPITSHVKIAIDVPNAYNFATLGGDTTIPTGKNAHSVVGGGTTLAFDDLDIGDPCIVYDAPRERYLAMGITGGGLVSAGNSDGGQNNGLALYERPARAGKDASWTPLYTKTVTFGEGDIRTLSNNQTFETLALNALKTAYQAAKQTALPATKGFFQGPGHGIVTTRDVTDHAGQTIPAGTVIFPMQWFGQDGGIQACALYAITQPDQSITWKSTGLTDYSGAHENCIVELDDGSWFMVAKYSNAGRAYMRTTDFLTWTPGQLKSPARYVQGSMLKFGVNKEGKSRYAMITATEGSNTYIRNNIKIFFATDDTANQANASGILWDDNATAITLFPGDSGQHSYNSICYLGNNVIGVAYEANKRIYFERIDLTDRLDP